MWHFPFHTGAWSKAACRVTGLAVVALSFPLAMASSPTSQANLRSVPAWARDAVWYQIFPERFRNGDPSNDPNEKDILGAWPHEYPSTWNISSWTGDWYALQPWEEKGGKGFYYRAQQRRYGGDLQGVIDKLDYLVGLGISAIYFNPLFQSPSLHKYDATMYHHIDKNFGPDPEGDRRIWDSEDPADPKTWKWTSADNLFLSLLQNAHRRGLHVIIDGVFNHVGTSFWAFRDVLEKGRGSPYKDWFNITRWDDPSTPANEFDYHGWLGTKELPEFRKDENGPVTGPREHIGAIVRRWMDPNGDGDPSDGIDGWRLDVADMVPLPFWREFRQWVRGINPEAYITGEVWWEDWNKGKMFNAAPWLQGDAFDAVMNYRFAREVCHFFKDKKKKIVASEFDKRLREIRRDYPSDVNYVLMNLLDSHDTDRLGSMIVNVDCDYDKRVGPSDNPDYDVRKPNAEELKTLRLMVLFQMTYLGAPMIYYGDEAGMWGGDDPDERKPMLWSELTYVNESSHPFGKPRPNDVNAFNQDIFDYYQEAIALRRSLPALAHGTFITLTTDDKADVYGFLRSYASSHVVVLLNNGLQEHMVTLRLPKGVKAAGWRVCFPRVSTEVSVSRGKVLVPAKSGVVLESSAR